MFKKSSSKHIDPLASLKDQLSGRKKKIIEDPMGWHNIFFKEVVCRIDESIFAVLYNERLGRPNAPIRVLVGMMILKEGNGWSDEQLFRECRFNMLVIASLGLDVVGEDVPTEATYYAFRKLVQNYETSTGIDLINESFRDITAQQICVHNVSGEKIRMDSKLINSNIALNTRLELILESVRKFVKGIEFLEIIKPHLSEQDYGLLKELKQKSATNIIYRLNKSEQEDLIERLGFIIKQLLEYYPAELLHAILKRIYEEQYERGSNDAGIDENDDTGRPKLKPSKEVSSGSVQSIHDPDAAYRKKGYGNNTQKVSGFHANVTETCDQENTINLILDIEVEAANISEDKFLISSIQSSEEVLCNAEEDCTQDSPIIQQATTDGGYDSNANRKHMNQEEMPQWNMGKTKGKKRRIKFYYDEKGELRAIDLQTDTECEVYYSEKLDKYVVIYPDEKKTRRYFTKEQIQQYFIVQQMQESQTPEDINLRANVESTIHHMFHRLLKRNKIKYRGLFKCKMYVTSRALWVNFVRIQSKMVKQATFSLIFRLWGTLGTVNTQRPLLKWQALVC